MFARVLNMLAGRVLVLHEPSTTSLVHHNCVDYPFWHARNSISTVDRLASEFLVGNGSLVHHWRTSIRLKHHVRLNDLRCDVCRLGHRSYSLTIIQQVDARSRTCFQRYTRAFPESPTDAVRLV